MLTDSSESSLFVEEHERTVFDLLHVGVVLTSHYGMDAEVVAMGAHAFLNKQTPPKEPLETLENLLRA